MRLKGKLAKVSGAKDTIINEVKDLILNAEAEIELPDVKKENLKEGMTVLVKGILGTNGSITYKHNPFYPCEDIVAILPSEEVKEKEIDWSKLKIQHEPFDYEKTKEQKDKINKLVSIVEEMYKKGK
jgi:aminoglycoside N3'-acetyltransferase